MTYLPCVLARAPASSSLLRSFAGPLPDFLVGLHLELLHPVTLVFRVGAASLRLPGLDSGSRTLNELGALAVLAVAAVRPAASRATTKALFAPLFRPGVASYFLKAAVVPALQHTEL